MSYREIDHNDLITRWKQKGKFLTMLNVLKAHKSTHGLNAVLREGRSDLRGLNLRKTRQPNTEFSNADLSNGQFYCAGLQRSRFRDTLLVGADFVRADLSDSSFDQCRMNDARFKWSILRNAKWLNCDLSGANLTGADFTGAEFREVILDGAVLYSAKGLDTVRAEGVLASGSEIEKAAYESLASSPLGVALRDVARLRDHQYDLAISFAGEDRQIAERIAQRLKHRQNLEVFYDEFEAAKFLGRDLIDYLSDLYANRAKYCLLLYSKNYRDKAYPNLERRAAQGGALKANREAILPIVLDDTPLPPALQTLAYLDFRRLAFDKLVSIVTERIIAG